jgi:hypothetical protein
MAALTAEQRLWADVDKTGDCWLWTGYTTDKGYGLISVEGRTVMAHRFAYELLVGPIPDGYDLDHRRTCPKRCVRPTHLRPATRSQNVQNHTGNTRATSGVRGVSWSRREGKFQARAALNGREYSGGYYATVGEAEAAAVALRNRLHTHNDVDREMEESMDEIAEPQFTPLERELRYRNAQLRKQCGKQGKTIHLLRAELAEVRVIQGKLDRSELRRLERFEEMAKEQFALDKERLERAQEHIAALEEKLAAKDEA